MKIKGVLKAIWEDVADLFQKEKRDTKFIIGQGDEKNILYAPKGIKGKDWLDMLTGKVGFMNAGKLMLEHDACLIISRQRFDDGMNPQEVLKYLAETDIDARDVVQRATGNLPSSYAPPSIK